MPGINKCETCGALITCNRPVEMITAMSQMNPDKIKPLSANEAHSKVCRNRQKGATCQLESQVENIAVTAADLPGWQPI